MLEQQDFIPLMKVSLGDKCLQEVQNVLKSGMLVMGKKVLEMEGALANYIGVKHCIAVSNGTASLHLILKALGIGKGDEVIIPALSYVATANVIELVGAKPVFVDVRLEDCNIDTSKIEALISTRTKAIMPVHEFGNAADMNTILSIAEKYNLKVIEDAACALGTKINGEHVGSFGIAGSFSFHPRKTITSGEGGVITTNDDELARKLKVLRNHGAEMIDDQMDFTEAGFNYRLTDIQAAMIIGQLKELDHKIKLKQGIFEQYNRLLENMPVQTPNLQLDTSYQSYHIILEVDNKDVIFQLSQQKIGSNYGAQCIPALRFYKDKYDLNYKEMYPNALKVFEQGLCLPLFEGLRHSEMEFVVEKLKSLI